MGVWQIAFLIKKGNFVGKGRAMENHERVVVKAAIMQSLSEEVDKWLDKQPAISSGYDYEAEFLKTSRSVNKIILEKSLGEHPGRRNDKKKYKRALEK